MLTLTRPLVFFDLETTGLDKETDRIVQIAMVKLMPGLVLGDRLAMRINPGMAIPESSTLIHGISDTMVATAPPFTEVAGQVYDFLFGCDVGGFNSNAFDVPFLFNELLRAGIRWESSLFKMVDAGNLFKIREPRTLTAAVQHYCHRAMQNAHDAEVDILETVNVFVAQLYRYPDLPDTIEELARYTNYGKRVADLSGKFVYDEQDQLRYNFGKHRGELVSDHLDFAAWMYRKADFPTDTNAILADLLGLYEY